MSKSRSPSVEFAPAPVAPAPVAPAPVVPLRRSHRDSKSVSRFGAASEAEVKYAFSYGLRESKSAPLPFVAPIIAPPVAPIIAPPVAPIIVPAPIPVIDLTGDEKVNYRPDEPTMLRHQIFMIEQACAFEKYESKKKKPRTE